MRTFTNDRPIPQLTLVPHRPSVLARLMAALTELAEVWPPVGAVAAGPATFFDQLDLSLKAGHNLDYGRKFPVYCGWCGKYLHESDVEHSTGICEKCRKEMEDQI